MMGTLAGKGYTDNCVRCLKPAKIWGGHVLDGKKKIAAGWCSDSCRYAQGFYGLYQPSMDERQDQKLKEGNDVD